MDKSTLKLEKLSFKFDKKGNYFFKDISLHTESGHLNFVCGPNGSGKSTLFRILRGKVGNDERVSGKYFLNNKELNEKNFSNLEQVRLVRQKFDLMLADKFDFEQNLQFAALPQKPSLKVPAPPSILPTLLERFGIDPSTQVARLSGGQRQILAILMVLQKSTAVLLLDEPTAALDEENATFVMDFLNDLAKTTDLVVIIISHDKDLVKKYSKEGFFNIVVDQATKIRNIKFINK